MIVYLTNGFSDEHRSISQIYLLPQSRNSRKMLLGPREEKNQLMLMLSRLSFSEKRRAEETKISVPGKHFKYFIFLNPNVAYEKDANPVLKLKEPSLSSVCFIWLTSIY